MLMRVRITELLAERGLTAYAVAKAANGQITPSQLYRLIQRKGRARYLDTRMLDALCAVFSIEPGELLESERPKRR